MFGMIDNTQSYGYIELKTLRFDRWNLALVYTNSLLFSALFSFDSIPAYLVRAVFNGLGIVMVTGLLSLLIGNIVAALRTSGEAFAPWGSYYSSALLCVLQSLLLLVFTVMVLVKHV